MGLEHLTILVESPGGTPGGKPQFGSATSDDTVVAMFNPNKLTVSRSVNWETPKPAKRDNPEMQFTGGGPATLKVDLLFDTYDTPEPEASKQSVKTVHTDKLLRLTTVEGHGDKHRPPVCRLQWGKQSVFFQGVIQQLEISFTMFTTIGVPVRATASCTFVQWKPHIEDLTAQNLMSSDVAKVWVVKRGQSLANIASIEYGDPRAWRLIADANGIDNPLGLVPGTRLMLPARSVPWNSAATS